MDVLKKKWKEEHSERKLLLPSLQNVRGKLTDM